MKCMKNKKQAEKSETAYNQKLEEFHKAEGLNEDFQKLEEKERQLLELSERSLLLRKKKNSLKKRIGQVRLKPMKIKLMNGVRMKKRSSRSS